MKIQIEDADTGHPIVALTGHEDRLCLPRQGERVDIGRLQTLVAAVVWVIQPNEPTKVRVLVRRIQNAGKGWTPPVAQEGGKP